MSFIIIAFLLFVSCNNEELNYFGSPQKEKQITMDMYDSIVISQRELIADFCIESQDHNYTRSLSENKSYVSLKQNLLPTAEKFIDDIGITNEDMNDIFGESIKTCTDKEDAVVALLMFSTVLDYSYAQECSITRGGSFKDCFLEATGIAAGTAIVGGLAKGMMTKATVRAALKMVARIGGRTLNGASLALLAGEIAWCMW